MTVNALKMVNKKEQYKIHKINTAQEVYYCECGKNYLSFASLYLHARNKHQVKLTTKISPDVCSIQQMEFATHYTYFISKFENTLLASKQ
jgi:hypothetical protein